MAQQIPYAILMARDTIARRDLAGSLLPRLEVLLDAAIERPLARAARLDCGGARSLGRHAPSMPAPSSSVKAQA